jgi:uncharacterized protein YecE (DUF72 family)
MPGNLAIGTSGWNYKAWKDGFYAGVPQKSWLAHYASVFDTVEVNATFYRQLQEKTYRKWLESTPEGFTFAVKGNRYVTHIKRLKEPEESVLKQKDNIAPLQEKLSAVLWQLPANLEFSPERLKRLVQALDKWPQVGHALEARHQSWFVPEVEELLREHGLAVCQSDAPDWPRWDRVTADPVYIRLHGNRELYQSEYTDDELQAWAEKIRGWRADGLTVQVYFDNTDAGHAPDNAQRLRSLLQAETD